MLRRCAPADAKLSSSRRCSSRRSSADSCTAPLAPSAQLAAAVAGATRDRPRTGTVPGHKGPGTDRTRGGAGGGQALPGTGDHVLQRRTATCGKLVVVVSIVVGVTPEDRRALQRVEQRERGHVIVLSKPTTRPTSCTSLLRIGS